MVRRTRLPSQKYLRSRLDYDPTSGELTWKALRATDRFDRAWNARFAGAAAGSKRPGGYCGVGINHVIYRAHRLIWRWMTGEAPAEIDHINGDGCDNRWDNLRKATHGQNGMNQRLRPNNTSGIKGVSWCNRQHQWVANICVAYGRRHLGYFDTKEEAAEAYRQGAKSLHGEFARLA